MRVDDELERVLVPGSHGRVGWAITSVAVNGSG